MKPIALLAFLMLTGCVITHGLEQIQQSHNLKAVTCAHDMEKGALTYATDTSKKCTEEVEARLANGKMSEEQYGQFLMHIEQLRREDSEM